MMIKPNPTWDTHEAKDKLSQLLADAQHQAQIILRYGKPFAVVIGYEAYMAKVTDEQSAWDVFKTLSVPQTLEPPERREQMRNIEF